MHGLRIPLMNTGRENIQRIMKSPALTIKASLIGATLYLEFEERCQSAGAKATCVEMPCLIGIFDLKATDIILEE